MADDMENISREKQNRINKHRWMETHGKSRTPVARRQEWVKMKSEKPAVSAGWRKIARKRLMAKAG